MIEKPAYVIDGSASYLDGFDASQLVAIDDQVEDYRMSSHWDKYRVIPTEWCGPEENRFVPTTWNGPKTEASEEKRIDGLKISWLNDERRKAASARMKDTRRTMKQDYSDERNAKVSEGMKKVWERRKLEKASQTKGES
jgi:hypothetical protein